MKKRMATKEGQEQQKKMTEQSAIANKKDPVYVALRRRCNVAKNRCTTPTSAPYKYYGGRGIEFRFSSPVEMALWILKHLGPPKNGDSLDRINNDGHYEPGNLRWADCSTQANNKRQYAVSDYGERVRRLHKLRPDYHVQSIRDFLKEGLSDEDIINKVKWDGCGNYVRHTELRTK